MTLGVWKYRKRKPLSKAHRRKLSESHKLWAADNDNRKQLSEVQNRPEVKEKVRRAALHQWNDPILKERILKAIRKANSRKHSPLRRIRNSETVTTLWRDPAYRAKQFDSRSKPEVKEKRRLAQMKAWSDPTIREKTVRATLLGNQIKPNKAEIKLSLILKRLFPKEYKFVGDGSFILGGKCPDFVNVNGQKKIIELFGDFWHSGDNGEERKKLFKSYGYSTLIVWEHELKEKRLLKKLTRFNSANWPDEAHFAAALEELK